MGTDQPGLFGALFAACYGVAQGFIHAAIASGASYQLINPFRLSLLSYDFSATNAPLPRRLKLPQAHVVGVGAVGCALVYALAHLAGCEGIMHLIDNDDVDGPNLERYILMRTQDIEEKKTDVAAALLRHGGLTVISHPRSFHEFQKEHGYNQELLITPVDSEFGRRKLATGLPKMVLNAATNGTNVTLSRHGFADGKACLHCLYLPKVEETTTEKRLAIDMGLAVDEVESLIAANEGISEDLVRRVEKNLGFETGKFQAWVGKHVTVHGQTSSVGQDCPVRWSRTAL